MENIKKAISNFNWSKTSENLSVDGKIEQHNKTLLNIFRNYIQTEKIKYDCQPPWINDNLKSYLKPRSKLTKIFYKNGLRKSDHVKVLEESTECTNTILGAKKTIFLKWLPNLKILILLQKLSGQYWIASSTIKSFLLLHLYYCKKANLFNNFFASICTPMKKIVHYLPSII